MILGAYCFYFEVLFEWKLSSLSKLDFYEKRKYEIDNSDCII